MFYTIVCQYYHLFNISSDSSKFVVFLNVSNTLHPFLPPSHLSRSLFLFFCHSLRQSPSFLISLFHSLSLALSFSPLSLALASNLYLPLSLVLFRSRSVTLSPYLSFFLSLLLSLSLSLSFSLSLSLFLCFLLLSSLLFTVSLLLLSVSVSILISSLNVAK